MRTDVKILKYRYQVNVILFDPLAIVRHDLDVAIMPFPHICKTPKALGTKNRISFPPKEKKIILPSFLNKAVSGFSSHICNNCSIL